MSAQSSTVKRTATLKAHSSMFHALLSSGSSRFLRQSWTSCSCYEELCRRPFQERSALQSALPAVDRYSEAVFSGMVAISASLPTLVEFAPNLSPHLVSQQILYRHIAFEGIQEGIWEGIHACEKRAMFLNKVHHCPNFCSPALERLNFGQAEV
jgi:hypothetical protein